MTRPRVVILGGGFAGIGAARALKKADVELVIVDEHDYHTFQPLLYQVATDLLDMSAVGHPLRDLFHEQPNVSVREATANAVDLEQRVVRFGDLEPLTYDYLVLGLGARVNFFGTDGAADHAFPMYTLPDAARLKRHLLRRWEAADRDETLASDGALNVVVVGGGPTGVESAGALAELYRTNLAADYPELPQKEARIILVEAGPALFPMFKPNLRAYAKRALEKRSVEVKLGEIVASVTPTRVTLKSRKVLKAHTLVWGAGLLANPIVRTFGLDLERGDRVRVADDLSVPGHPEVYAAGDIAWIAEGKDDVLPQLGSVALQSGERSGRNIARAVEGKKPKAFEYKDKGTMATIGRGSAVIQMRRGHTLKGKPASLAWGAVHLALLSTGEDRAKAAVEWTWAGFTHERAARIDVNTDEE